MDIRLDEEDECTVVRYYERSYNPTIRLEDDESGQTGKKSTRLSGSAPTEEGEGSSSRA